VLGCRPTHVSILPISTKCYWTKDQHAAHAHSIRGRYTYHAARLKTSRQPATLSKTRPRTRRPTRRARPVPPAAPLNRHRLSNSSFTVPKRSQSIAESSSVTTVAGVRACILDCLPRAGGVKMGAAEAGPFPQTIFVVQFFFPAHADGEDQSLLATTPPDWRQK
jgi:hypothetical protein